MLWTTEVVFRIKYLYSLKFRGNILKEKKQKKKSLSKKNCKFVNNEKLV